MGLRNIFNKKGPRTSTTPTGEVLHIGERPWENYDWVTTGHPVFYRMEKNKHGSYDIVHKMKSGALPFKHKMVQKRHLSESEALNMLLTQELNTARKFGGFRGKTVADLTAHIQARKYPRGHIFTYVKKHPEVLTNWAKDRNPPARKAAPKNPGI